MLDGIHFSRDQMIHSHECKINNTFNQQKLGTKKDPPNNSCDKIGTNVEIGKYTWLIALCATSRTPFISLVLLLPISSI